MISYCEMRGWRDICEYLSTAYYRFDTVAEIRRKCPKILPSLYDPKNKTHRKPLWDAYKIQFLTWRQHPILDYRSSRRYRREYKDEWGSTAWLCLADGQFYAWADIPPPGTTESTCYIPIDRIPADYMDDWTKWIEKPNFKPFL
jgi:hypothetical protein